MFQKKFENKKKKILFKKKKIQLNKTNDWIFSNEIKHKTGKFFKIFGYLVKTNFPKKSFYYQPLILQKEIGYLAIFKSIEKNKTYFLLQLKAEPGNKNLIQLSPTIQATKSNYLRVHKGKKTKFIEFTKNTNNFLLNSNQPEQGSKYKNKYNKNLIIKTRKFKNLPRNFIWLSIKEIKKLSKKNNILNMDTISIFSCYLKKVPSNNTVNSFKHIKKKYLDFKNKYKIKILKKSISELKGWKQDDYSIYDKKKKFFKIQSFEINTDFREINNWSQPLISDYGKTLNVLFINQTKSQVHYLCKLILEPGYDLPRFTNTIFIQNYKSKHHINNFLKKHNFLLKKKILDVTNSDEGGRFYNNKCKNIVLEVENIKKLERQNYVWISYNQMLQLIKKKLVTIELRNLFGILNIEKLK